MIQFSFRSRDELIVNWNNEENQSSKRGVTNILPKIESKKYEQCSWNDPIDALKEYVEPKDVSLNLPKAKNNDIFSNTNNASFLNVIVSEVRDFEDFTDIHKLIDRDCIEMKTNQENKDVDNRKICNLVLLKAMSFHQRKDRHTLSKKVYVDTNELFSVKTSCYKGHGQ